MNILITGANGFLGSTIVEQALASGIHVRSTDIQKSPVISGVDYDRSDIRDPSSIKPLPEGLTCVIHAAGLAHIFDGARVRSAPFFPVNVTGTVNMINAASMAGVRHFVLISSVSVYGPFTRGNCNEDAPCDPAGLYATSKYDAEVEAKRIADSKGMALTILRLATLYGEKDPGNLGRLIRSLDRGRFVWVGDGSNRKSLLYKEDAARACLEVASRPASGIGTYNVSAPSCTMREVVDAISNALGKRPLSLAVPAGLALLLASGLSKIPSRRTSGIYQTVMKWLSEDVYDTGRFREAYDFQTKVGLKEGLKREVDWYCSNKRVN